MKPHAVVDFETEEIVPGSSMSPKPVGVAIYRKGRASYLSWGHPVENNSTQGKAAQLLGELSRSHRLIFHNASFDVRVLEDWFGMKPEYGFEDTKILAFLLDPLAQTLSLKPLSETVLGMPPIEQGAMHDWLREHYPPARRVKDPTRYTAQAPGRLAGRYAKGDVIRTWKLFRHLRPKLDIRELLAYQRELAVVPIAIQMERTGIRIDLDRLERDLKKAETRRRWLERDLYVWLGEINLNSWQQLATAIESRGLLSRGWELTPKGRPKTSIEGLRNVCSDQGLVDALELYSKLGKLIGTYMRPWLESGGRFYPYYNTTRTDGELGGTRTGRFSSNFQQVPKTRYEKLPYMKDYVLAEEGCVLIDRDYDQQELRILAHFERGELRDRYRAFPTMDLHAEVAKLMGVDRQVAKICNFLTIYGGGTRRLAQQLGVLESEAKFLRAKHNLALPGVRELTEMIQRKGVVRTWGGRIYELEFGFEYKGINILIQGSAADQIKEAMRRLQDIPMIQVHDELLFSVPEDELDECTADIRWAMEEMEGWGVPMLTDVKYGDRWGEVA